jgi:putative CRISPR-associated protein (TIGR02619 family)
MTTIITTTGISLIGNTRKEFKNQSPTETQMLHYLKANPIAASAESNSLLQIIQPGDHLVFLYTREAEQCASLLKEFFISEKAFKPFQIKVKELHLSANEADIETRGLRNLINTLIGEIEIAQRNKQNVIINATAGFKVLIAYSTMIGMIYNVPVKYLYEDFRRVVTLNPLALDWDTSLFLTYEDFFQWLDGAGEARQYQEVEQRLKALPDSEKIRSLLTEQDKDGYVYLSDMGEVLRRRFAQQTQEAENAPWPPEVKGVPIDDKIASSLLLSKHHPINKLLQFARKTAELPYVQEIVGGFFENTTLSRIKSSNEDGTIHLLWADNEKAQNLIISTTARGKLQTLKVANKIKEIMRDL